MFKKPFSFNGRIRRAEYGISLIILLLVYSTLTSFIDIIIEDLTARNNYQRPNFIYLFIFLYIPLIWFISAQSTKRCHDLGKNGLYQFVPFYFIFLIFWNSEKDFNIYGKNPKVKSNIVNDENFNNISIDNNHHLKTKSNVIYDVIAFVFITATVCTSLFICCFFYYQHNNTSYSSLLKLLEKEEEKLEVIKNSEGFWGGFYQNGKIPYYSHYEDFSLNKEITDAYERVKNGNGNNIDKQVVQLNEDSKYNDFIFKNTNEKNYNLGKLVRNISETLLIFLLIFLTWKLLKKNSKTINNPNTKHSDNFSFH